MALKRQMVVMMADPTVEKKVHGLVQNLDLMKVARIVLTTVARKVLMWLMV